MAECEDSRCEIRPKEKEVPDVIIRKLVDETGKVRLILGKRDALPSFYIDMPGIRKVEFYAYLDALRAYELLKDRI